MKKYNFCLMNPPYGMGTDTVHLKFVDKCLDIANKQVTIMPFKFIKKDHKIYKKYKEKEKWSSSLKEVDEVNSNVFNNVAMESVAIYYFDDDPNDDIYINTLNKDYVQTIHHFEDYKETNEYEDQLLSYLCNDHIKERCMWAGGYGHESKKHFMRLGYSKDEAQELSNEEIKKNCMFPLKLNKKVYLILNTVAHTTFFSKNAGMIFTDLKDFEKHALKMQFSHGFWVMGFDTIKDAENCKDAMTRPLLRFGMSKANDSLIAIPRKSYKYVPDINWSDDRVKTDEGLLKVCGCPKDKCKEYADYCKKIIDEIDARK